MRAVIGRLAGMSYDEANRVVVGEVFATLDANAGLPRLAATVEQWRPDVIVRDPAEFASWLLAERRHVPHPRVAIGLLSSDASYAGVAAPALAAAAEASGLPPDPGGRRLIDGPVIAAAPPTFDPSHGLDPRSVHRYGSPHAPRGALPSLLPRGDDPLVYVTFGTAAGAAAAAHGGHCVRRGSAARGRAGDPRWLRHRARWRSWGVPMVVTADVC